MHKFILRIARLLLEVYKNVPYTLGSWDLKEWLIPLLSVSGEGTEAKSDEKSKFSFIRVEIKEIENFR